MFNKLNENGESKWALWGCYRNVYGWWGKCFKSLINIFNDMDVEFVSTNFKEKGDRRNPNSYRGIKLLEHAFKHYKKILVGCLHEVVDIDKMQYGFMPGRLFYDC